MAKKNKAIAAGGFVLGAAFWYAITNSEFSFQWRKKA